MQPTMRRERLPYLQKKEYSASELHAVFPVHAVPETLYKMECEYLSKCAVDRLPWKTDRAIEVPAEGSSPDTVYQEKEHAAPAVDVSVLLLNLSKTDTRYSQHWTKVIVRADTKGVLTLYGGLHEEVDGASPKTSLETQVATAVRHLKEQCNLDLSFLPAENWVRVLTYHHKPKPGSSTPELSVFLLPLYWTAPGDNLSVARICVQQQTNPKTKETKTTRRKSIEVSVHSLATEKGFLFGQVLLQWLTVLGAREVVAGMERHRDTWSKKYAKKRDRDEIIARVTAAKRTRVEGRNQELEAKLKALKQKWDEDDAGKTEEELEEDMKERKQVQDELKAGLTKKWDEEDKASAQEEVPPEESEEPAAEDTGVVDRKLLAACSVFDPELGTFGANPSDQFTLDTLQCLVAGLSSTPMSLAEAGELVRRSVPPSALAGGKVQDFRYRALTDQ